MCAFPCRPMRENKNVKSTYVSFDEIALLAYKFFGFHC